MPQRDSGKHTWMIKNEGEADLHLKMESSTCSCTLARFKDGKMAEPGAKTPEPTAKTTGPDGKTLAPDGKTAEPGTRVSATDAKTSAPEGKTPATDAAAQVPAGTDADTRDDAADAAHMAGPEMAVADATAENAGLVDGEQYDRPAPPPGVRPIGSLTRPGRATVEGRVYAVEIRPVEHNTVLATEIADSTGQLTALFYGRSHIPGVECGARVRFRGQVGMRSGGPVMINPAYELVAPGAPGQAGRRSVGDGDPAQDDSPKRRGPRRRKDR